MAHQPLPATCALGRGTSLQWSGMENGWCGLPSTWRWSHLEDPGKKIRVFLYNTTRDRVELAITSDQLLKNQDLWEGMKVNTREFLNYVMH